MQTHPLDLWEDEVAADVADIFSDALADGLSVRTATRRVLEELDDYLDDDEQRPRVWVALAVLQLEQNALQPIVRRHALVALAHPDAFWPAQDEEEGEDPLTAERQHLIAQLTTQLTPSIPCPPQA